MYFDHIGGSARLVWRNERGCCPTCVSVESVVDTVTSCENPLWVNLSSLDAWLRRQFIFVVRLSYCAIVALLFIKAVVRVS